MNKKIEIELSDDLVNAYIPLSEAYDKGFKEGEKEVVDWCNEQCPHAGPPDDDPTQIKRHCNRCWREKGWGIDD